MNEAGWEIATHGLKWIDYRDIPADVEARHIAEAIRIHTEVAGARPLGFYQGRSSVNTIRLGMEEGGFVYCADSYADDLPYWLEGPRGPQLMVPYTLDSNDMRFATAQGFNTGDQFYAYLKDSFDTLYAEGEVAPKMLSIGLHCRLVGRPGRAAALARFVDYALSHDRVWIPTRLDIARHWIHRHPPPDGWKPSRLTRTLFVERFGGVYEHSPWVAAAAWDAGLAAGSDTAEGLAKALAAAAAKGSAQEKRALIEAHPDLAGKLALARTLTPEFDQRAGERGARPSHARGIARVRHAQRLLSRPLRLSLHHGGQGKEQGRNPCRLPPPPRQRRRCRDHRRARRNRPDRGAAAQGHPVLSAKARVIRGRILSFNEDPAVGGPSAYSLIADGAVLVAGGRIEAVGRANDVLPRAPRDAVVDDHASCLIMAGFIDAHIHYPQTQVIGSYGAQLLDWLHNYTFVEEQKFADPAHCARVADFFLDELFRSGTTTAMVYCTVHPESVEAFFAAAETRGARMIAGKVMMDRDAPPGLMDTAQRGYDESKALIERWRGRGRLDYAITPRFAVTSTEAQLDAAGALRREFPDCYVQTHADENKAEIARVAELFPEAKSYIDVYARAGLTGPRSVFGHCIHLLDGEVAELVASRSVAAFCPTSNLFLGSGLFDEARLAKAGVRIALATDVGGGTSYSMLHTAAEGYKVLQLNRQSWPALHAFYRMTLGNARALSLDRHIGSVEAGKEADLVALDPHATPALEHRMETAGGDLEVELFALMMMGDDRAVRQTYVAGTPRKL